MIQSWKEFLKTAPKFDRNWEPGQFIRSKTAPTAEKPTRKPRPRPKPKTAPKDESNDQSAFEEFKFETPPVTPPPEKVEIVKRKDNEFWDFYEKGGM